MSLSALLRRIVDLLDDAQVPYMLTGSLAAAYYSSPRATKDIDVVIETDANGVERLVDALGAAQLYVDREAALAALRAHGQFNAIDPESGWKVDLIVRKERSFSKAEFERRVSAAILGVDVWLATLEDVLIAKMEWGALGDSELQRRDVVELLERARSHMDLEYIQHWTAELGLSSEWTALQARVAAPPSASPED